ncbi:MAG: TonB-dependent receptor [Bacteroidetes bacterium]|nr:TonB-dependent receptor [Bacteroidota bacterium]
MLRKLLSTLSIVVASAGLMLSQNESAIKVKLTDKATKETIPFANVVVEMGGIQVGVGTTNIDGEVTIKPINPGKYNVKGTYVGYQAVEIDNVNVSVGKTVSLTMEMLAGQQLDVVEVVEYSEPLIDPDTKSGATVTREEYQNMATKSINSVAATTAGVYQADEGGALNVRGARSEGTAYYVDGQKVIGSSGVPQSAVEQITTIVGGTPAEYGDATGGIIAITTRGPASRYSGGVEVSSSGFGDKKGLDAFGYNYAGFNVAGPIIVKKDSTSGAKKSVLGFSINGDATFEKDPSPSAIGFYQVNPDKLAQLEAYPLRPSTQGEGYVLSSEYTTANDLQKIKARNNVASNTLRLSGKIQYQPTTNMGITIGGSVDYNKRHDFVYEYALFNPVNNPSVTDNTWRIYAKLTQKFNSNTAKEEERSSSNIKNAYFTIQASYEKTKSKTEDDDHKGNIFDYGYIGKFQQHIRPTYEYVDSLEGRYQNGFEYYNLTYTPGTENPTGTPYTNQFYALTDPSNINYYSDVQQGLGLMNGDRPASIYGLWYNTGRQYNGYSYDDRSQFRVFANFSADIKKHAVQLGFEYEQRTERAYSLSPIGLWTRMREITNAHIQGLDKTNPILNDNPDDDSFWLVYPHYDYARLNDNLDPATGQPWADPTKRTQYQFDRSLRQKLGYDPNGTQWIDIDSYAPSTYSIDMFSADDLLNVGGTQYVGYYGYDHTGKKLNSNPSLDDFFTKTDADGNFTREIGAYRPIYIAGYIQDKFDFKDLKFNVGLRIDRFDANQKVLKDKYLLYETKTAGEVDYSAQATARPSNIGDDYAVYVYDSYAPTPTVIGYRNGDTWYNAAGAQISDPSLLTGSATADGGINPYLLDPTAAKQKLVTSRVFTDYKPQINFMPRIAFAFPISDVANFFAHYDVLTQRPPGANRLDPVEYLQLANKNVGTLNNPGLKPERTTDYELGFTQVLNEKKNSAITISAFYRELRNMIQVVSVTDAYPITYTTYDNIDFGTVKGLSFAYDLRRMASGVQLTASYTLQFADGTGSSSSDGFNLASSGQPNLRTLHALDYDQRHTVILNVDYRFGAGKDYNGPNWTRKKGTDKEKTIQLLKNVGANVVFRAGSGTPYSKQSNISADGYFDVPQRRSLEGSINGSNLPWNFKVDLKIDKDVELSWGGKKDGQEKKHANLNVYLQVLNLLNTKNILNVYRATGNPGDDGYLASATAQSDIAAKTNATAFQDLYYVRINNPSNYSRPRVIRLGLMLDF